MECSNTCTPYATHCVHVFRQIEKKIFIKAFEVCMIAIYFITIVK